MEGKRGEGKARCLRKSGTAKRGLIRSLKKKKTQQGEKQSERLWAGGGGEGKKEKNEGENGSFSLRK